MWITKERRESRRSFVVEWFDKLEFISFKRQSLLNEKDCGLLKRTHFVRTFAGREVFFATYTPRQKTPKVDFAAAAAKLCEASSSQVRSRGDPCGRPSNSPPNPNLSLIRRNFLPDPFHPGAVCAA